MKEYIEKEKLFDCLDIKNALGGHYGISLTAINAIPAADVVDGKAYRELLKAARSMHLWIFRNTCNELEAYDECGLSDEMNNLLGYGGELTIKMDGGEDDV